MQEIKCFMIDDDIDDRDFFQIALEISDLPFRLTTAGNGITALELLSQDSYLPDFIFLDLNMPLLSGKECLSAIRELPKLQDVPLVIFSTSSYHKDIEETKELGATYFLSKTSDIDRLAVILNDVLTGKELPYVLS